MQSKVIDLGLVDFEEALLAQKKIFAEIKNGYYNSALIVCRHYPVFTLGRAASKENLLVSGDVLNKLNIKVLQIDRGGDVTYHGPGQLILYPIFNLNYFRKDIHWFLRSMENAVIKALGEFGVKGMQISGLTGVWLGKKKLASIGIAVKNWITYHGVAINIKSADLENFSLIRPCGMDIMMTSLESCLGRQVQIEEFKEIITGRWGNDQSNFA